MIGVRNDEKRRQMAVGYSILYPTVHGVIRLGIMGLIDNLNINKFSGGPVDQVSSGTA